MNPAAFAVRNWQFTLVLTLLFAALGLNAFLSIPRAEDPTFNAPFFSVVTLAPGMEAVEVEKLITDKIEDAFNELDDLVEIRSTTTNGVSAISVQFDWALPDMDRKYDEIIREMNRLRPELPDAVIDIKVRKGQPGLTNIVQIALVGDVSYRELTDRARDLRDRLEAVKGVRQVEIWGAPEPELRVALDLARMSRLGVSIDQVKGAIQGENAEIPGGVVDAGGTRLNLKTTGAYASLDEVADTIVAANGPSVVRVRDIAEVSWSEEEEAHTARFNGRKAVFVTANQRDRQNIFAVRDGIVAAAEAFRSTLPGDVRLEVGFDQSLNVENRLGQLGEDFLIAIGLVLLTLLPLGLRASLVVMFSIPLSLALGVFFLQGAGFSLNQLSIAGFVLSLGLLVDDSIVVVENIARHIREGARPREAAITATRQIALAVLGCTATLMLAFLPLMFLPEGAGAFTRSLPTAVLLTIAASLLVSMTIIPFIASRMLKEEKHHDGNIVLRTVMGAIHTLYRPLLHRALSHPVMTVVIAAGLFGGTLMLVPSIGFSLFPPADSRLFLVQLELPEGASLAKTDEALQFVEAELNRHPEIKVVMSNLGRGNPRIYYNVNQRELSSNVAEVFAGLEKFEPGKTPRLMDDLRAVFDTYPGAKILVKVFENGPPLEAPVAIRVRGPEVEGVRRLAAGVEDIMRAVPGMRDVNNASRATRTDLKVDVDAGKAALIGIAPGTVDRVVRLAVAGEFAGDFRDGDGESYPITLRLPLKDHHAPDVLDQIYVPAATGAAAPLSQVATVRFDASPARIDRFDRLRSATVTGYPASGFLASNLTSDVMARVKAIALPPGYSIVAGGEAEASAKSLGGMGSAALVAAFGIFAVLILEFRSFKSSLIVASVVPLGLIGGFLGLFVSGYTLSFTAMIGMIALIGIEIKNSILLVDFTNQLRDEGVPLREAIERAGEVRFLPILLTSVTAIFGLLPLALQGSGLYSPLACVIIGGLVTSTLLSRLVTPACYLLLAPRDRTMEGFVIPEHAAGLVPGE
ncbi:MAG: efflux RND transporter permease subunit [Alphaproteobacteria bacterium]|nr:efflux RND transporter permease subunit [Alphaproteobacteria bacterium]